MSQGWYGFDFDGTLAYYKPGVHWGGNELGEPIQPIVELARSYLKAGEEIRIMTARVCELPVLINPDTNAQAFLLEHPDLQNAVDAVHAIRKWCRRHLGQVVPITCMKDYNMITLYDDRAIQVVHNKGIIIEA